MAQSYAPAPRVATPAQPAASADVCAPALQGQGSAGDACKRECARNPLYSPHCAKPAVPNWGVPANGAPANAVPAVPSPGGVPAAPATDHTGTRSAGTVPDGNANTGATKGATPVPKVTAPSTSAAASRAASPAASPATATAYDANRRAPTIARPAAAPLLHAPGTAAFALPASAAPVVAPAAPAAASTGSVASQPAPVTVAAPPAPTPVKPMGGTLSGSAPPGGVPIQVPSGGPSTAAANAIAPGKVDPPKFDRAAFDVDFGPARSGHQVRRTVVLNTSTHGEAEFSLTIPNAPGFSIAEVRVMGQGAVVPSASVTQAPMPSSGPRPLQDSAARRVASSAKAPPWNVQFSGPAEVQVDLVYAPTFDAFNNAAGPKMGVLNATVRNGAGAGGASIALRAAFQGATLQPVVVPAERELVAIFGEKSIALSVALTSTGQKGVAVVRLRSPHPGIAAPDVAAQLLPGQTARVTLTLILSPAPSPATAEDLKRSIVAGNYTLTIEVSGAGFGVQLPIALDVLDALQWLATKRDCDGQIPAYFGLEADLRYDVGSRSARCVGLYSISQSTDWFRKAGSFDWTLFFGGAQIASRAGWSYPGGAPVPESRTFRASCGELTRDQYIRSYRGQDPWRLLCTPRT
jgi:hypothetical protein